MSDLLQNKEAAIERMGDKALYVDIARLFAYALPETETAIAEALEQKAWADARRLVHSLKSNCASVGAEGLREEVYCLEKACLEADEAKAGELFAALRDDLQTLREELFAL